ncbi:transposase [Streptomyces sp. NBC_01794]|uniref:transposase n=1 Tax=Streptomyces sp. NBC_01794 TaxID=2975942 RepID=UPI003873CA13
MAVRHGVTSLFAAFNIADGTVIGELHRRHRAIDFKKFLVTIDEAVPAQLDVHLVRDNYATHNAADIKSWVARHPRFHVHFTPTGSGVGADLEVGPAEFVLDLFVALLDPVPDAVDPHYFGQVGCRVRAVRLPWSAGPGQVGGQIPGGLRAAGWPGRWWPPPGAWCHPVPTSPAVRRPPTR